MPVKTRAQLQAEAAQIANETAKRQNTATRVGNALLDVIDSAPIATDIPSVTALGVSVTNTGAANDTAIAAALAAYTELYWPDGAYPSAASIPSLHTVRHRGPGRITRGASTFYVDPSNAQSNTIYVDTAGSSANDGLTASEPMRGYQNAIDALKNYGPVLEGTWTVQFAAGTYSTATTDFGTTQVGIRSRKSIVLQGATVGAYPAVPTTIIQGSGAAAQGWAFTRCMDVKVVDVKFTSFSAGQALLATYFTKLECTNVHTLGNLYDLYCTDQSNVRLNSGILDGNSIGSSSQGVTTIIACTHQVGTTGGSAGDVVIKNHGIGASFNESSSGHCNATFQDCVYGARTDSAGRGNFDTSDFQRCTTAAVRLGANGQAYGLNTCVFNTGAAAANTRNIVVGGGAVDASQDENTTTPRVYQCTQNQVTHTGTTAETNVFTFPAFPARRFPHTFNVSKTLEACMFGTFTGASGIRTFRARLGTASGVAGTLLASAVVSGAPTGAYRMNLKSSLGLTSQRAHLAVLPHAALPSAGYGAQSVATNDGSDYYLTITIELGSSGDTVTINTRELSISG